MVVKTVGKKVTQFFFCFCILFMLFFWIVPFMMENHLSFHPKQCRYVEVYTVQCTLKPCPKYHNHKWLWYRMQSRCALASETEPTNNSSSAQNKRSSLTVLQFDVKWEVIDPLEKLMSSASFLQKLQYQSRDLNCLLAALKTFALISLPYFATLLPSAGCIALLSVVELLTFFDWQRMLGSGLSPEFKWTEPRLQAKVKSQQC